MPRRPEAELYINIENNDTVVPLEQHSEQDAKSQKIDVDDPVVDVVCPVSQEDSLGNALVMQQGDPTP